MPPPRPPYPISHPWRWRNAVCWEGAVLSRGCSGAGNSLWALRGIPCGHCEVLEPFPAPPPPPLSPFCFSSSISPSFSTSISIIPSHHLLLISSSLLPSSPFSSSYLLSSHLLTLPFHAAPSRPPHLPPAPLRASLSPLVELHQPKPPNTTCTNEEPGDHPGQEKTPTWRPTAAPGLPAMCWAVKPG